MQDVLDYEVFSDPRQDDWALTVNAGALPSAHPDSARLAGEGVVLTYGLTSYQVRDIGSEAFRIARNTGRMLLFVFSAKDEPPDSAEIALSRA